MLLTNHQVLSVSDHVTQWRYKQVRSVPAWHRNSALSRDEQWCAEDCLRIKLSGSDTLLLSRKSKCQFVHGHVKLWTLPSLSITELKGLGWKRLIRVYLTAHHWISLSLSVLTRSKNVHSEDSNTSRTWQCLTAAMNYWVTTVLQYCRSTRARVSHWLFADHTRRQLNNAVTSSYRTHIIDERQHRRTDAQTDRQTDRRTHWPTTLNASSKQRKHSNEPIIFWFVWLVKIGIFFTQPSVRAPEILSDFRYTIYWNRTKVICADTFSGFDTIYICIM